MIKMLIVDDEPEICGYIGNFFKKRGHKTFILTDPSGVLSLIEKEEPQVVLLDILMPGASGLEILKQIKSKYKDAVKVIMLTIADDQATKTEAFSRGADGFVKKPFTTDYLESVVMKEIEELLALRKKEE
ncbi:MAG: response regulator [Candidatus Omnitrophota bacterium]